MMMRHFFRALWERLYYAGPPVSVRARVVALEQLHLASSRRFSLANAAGAALRLPGINRQELTIALAEWREREDDATVRGVLDRVLVPEPWFVSPIELDPVLNEERN